MFIKKVSLVMLYRVLRSFVLCLLVFPVFANNLSFQDNPYHVNVEADGNSYIWVKFSIDPDFYLYQSKIQIITPSYSHVKLGDYVLPDPIELDSAFESEKKLVYKNNVAIQIPITNFSDGILDIDISYQGCKSNLLCLPEQQISQQVNLNNNQILSKKTDDAPIIEQSSQSNNQSLLKISDDSLAINSYLSTHGSILSLFAFFIFGILLSFTPCVFPMLPILLMVVSRKENTLRQNFILALTYVLGSAVIYAIAGVIAAILGVSLTEWLQSWWVSLVVGGLFLVFALSMFGYFEIRLPIFLQNKLNAKSQQINTNSLVGVFILGAVSTLVLSPCVTAPLAGALMYIANSQDIVLGASSLFLLGLGSGIPLLIIAVFGKEVLPKNGSWMEYIKIIFAIILLAMAAYMLSKLFIGYDLEIILGLVFFSCYQILRKINYVSSSPVKFKSILGILVLIIIFIYNHYSSQRMSMADEKFTVVTTVSEYNQQMELAKINNQIILVDFYASWCSACKEMDFRTFSNDEVIKHLSNFRLIRIDSSKKSVDIQKLQSIYGVFALPSMIFVYPDGRVIDGSQLYGFTTPHKFIEKIQNVNELKSQYCALSSHNC